MPKPLSPKQHQQRVNAARRRAALWTPEEHFDISARGGMARARAGTGHQWTPEEARQHARVGGSRLQEIRAERRRARRLRELARD